MNSTWTLKFGLENPVPIPPNTDMISIFPNKNYGSHMSTGFLCSLGYEILQDIFQSMLRQILKASLITITKIRLVFLVHEIRGVSREQSKGKRRHE